MLVRAESVDTALNEADDYLKQVKQRLETEYPHLSVLTVVKLGHPAEAIDEVLRHSSASLVVMATHGHGGIVRSITGSVAGEVLKENHAPLVLVRPAPHVDQLAVEGLETPAIV